MTKYFLLACISIVFILASCKKDDSVNTPSVPFQKKYLTKAVIHAVSDDAEVADYIIIYNYDVQNRLLSEVRKDVPLSDVNDSIVYNYNGTDTLAAGRDGYDKLPGGDVASDLFFYNTSGDLIKDSLPDEGAINYRYIGDKIIITAVNYAASPIVTELDTLIKDGSDNISSVTFHPASDDAAKFLFTFDTNVFNPFFGTVTGGSPLDLFDGDPDTFGDLLAPFGKNAITTLTVQSATDPGVLPVSYSEIVDHWPGKMTIPSSAGTGYIHETFTYK